MANRDLDPDAVRAAWDRAADAYAAAQADGLDHYRSAYFGPAQIAMCGDVAGLRVLDVGCGAGYFARAMAERGAQVTAIDLSARMIDHARAGGGGGELDGRGLPPVVRAAEGQRGGIDYRVLDAARIADAFDPAGFDLVTSCLALQDMPDPAAVLRAIAAVLRPGGRLVASITHPCGDTPFRRWQRDERGDKQYLCVDRYFERGPIEVVWPRWAYPFTTQQLHVPLEDWFAWIVGAGLTVRGFREPVPSDAALAAHPDLADARRVPYFAILDLAR